MWMMAWLWNGGTLTSIQPSSSSEASADAVPSSAKNQTGPAVIEIAGGRMRSTSESEGVRRSPISS